MVARSRSKYLSTHWYILPFWSNLRLGGEHLSPELESDQFRLTTANVCGKIRKIGEKCGLAIGCLRHLGTAWKTLLHLLLLLIQTVSNLNNILSQLSLIAAIGGRPYKIYNICYKSKSGSINHWRRTGDHFSAVQARISLWTTNNHIHLCFAKIPWRHCSETKNGVQ